MLREQIYSHVRSACTPNDRAAVPVHVSAQAAEASGAAERILSHQKQHLSANGLAAPSQDGADWLPEEPPLNVPCAPERENTLAYLQQSSSSTSLTRDDGFPNRGAIDPLAGCK